jgi:hypothetical protein
MSSKDEQGVKITKGNHKRPYNPPAYDDQIVIAIQMLSEGKANEGQQTMALDWIVHELCKTYDLSYRPNEFGGDRDTVFAEGKRFVGLELVKMTKLKVGRMQHKEENYA